jgi:PadR family transcriptional regulator AphA
MSGHELSTIADKSIAHFWSIPRSLVYRELVRLEEGGFLRGFAIAQSKFPDKREFELTDAGRQALTKWLNEPGFERGKFKDGFLVKFFFGNLIDPDSRKLLLQDYRSQAESYLQDLKSIAAHLEGRPGAEFPRLTALRGIRAAEGQLRWLDDVERIAAENPQLFESTKVEKEEV